MIYGDIPWEDDADIINCRLDDLKPKLNSWQQQKHNQQGFYRFDHYRDVDDLIRMCLKLNDSERIRLDELLQHKWFSKHNGSSSSQGQSQSLSTSNSNTSIVESNNNTTQPSTSISLDLISCHPTNNNNNNNSEFKNVKSNTNFGHSESRYT